MVPYLRMVDEKVHVVAELIPQACPDNDRCFILWQFLHFKVSRVVNCLHGSIQDHLL